MVSRTQARPLIHHRRRLIRRLIRRRVTVTVTVTLGHHHHRHHHRRPPPPRHRAPSLMPITSAVLHLATAAAAVTTGPLLLPLPLPRALTMCTRSAALALLAHTAPMGKGMQGETVQGMVEGMVEGMVVGEMVGGMVSEGPNAGVDEGTVEERPDGGMSEGVEAGAGAGAGAGEMIEGSIEETLAVAGHGTAPLAIVEGIRAYPFGHERYSEGGKGGGMEWSNEGRRVEENPGRGEERRETMGNDPDHCLPTALQPHSHSFCCLDCRGSDSDDLNSKRSK